MDVLWRRQVDLHTILKTLPADSWTVTGGVFVREKLWSPAGLEILHTFQSLSRGLSRDEWRRFKKYTARVITLGVPTLYIMHLRDYTRASVSVETIQQLGMESQRGGFWPKLRWFKCNIGWDLVPFIPSFTSPTITRLDLTLPHESNTLLQPTLSLLAHTCRQLQSLAVDANISCQISSGEMGRFISASRHSLFRIKIKPFTPPEIFPMVFDLPRLQDLTMYKPHPPNQIPPNMSPHLQHANFHGDASRLTTVTITRGGIIQLSTILESMCGASATMQLLCFSPVMGFDHSSITLLRLFINLTNLLIGCVCEDLGPGGSCNLQPTDENVPELGEALPHIRSLSLAPGCRAPRHVTFTSLIRLSRTCGDLERLSIRVISQALSVIPTK